MGNKTIPILVETPYAATKWCGDVIRAAKNEAVRYDYCLDIKDYTDINSILQEYSAGYIMVLGTDIIWVKEAIYKIKKHGGRVILIFAEPVEAYENICAITPDRSEMMIESIRYLSGAERTRISLFGFNNNATSDVLRQKVFFDKCAEFGVNASEHDVYINNGSIKVCFESFIRNADKYNAVICANDAAAVYLMKEIVPYQINIPEHLFVIGNGNTVMSKMVTPSLTSITLNFEEVGCQAVQMYRYLSTQQSIYSMNTTVACKIIARESTNYFKNKITKNDHSFLKETKDQFFYDTDIKQFLMMEDLFCKCDEIDFEIIKGLMEKNQYETLADKLYISLPTLKYRLKKIFSAVKVNSGKQFISLMNYYNINL